MMKKSLRKKQILCKTLNQITKLSLIPLLYCLLFCCLLGLAAGASAGILNTKTSLLESMTYPVDMHIVDKENQNLTDDFQTITNDHPGSPGISFQFIHVKPRGGRRDIAQIAKLLKQPPHVLTDTELMNLPRFLFPSGKTRKVGGRNVLTSYMTRETTLIKNGINKIQHTEYMLIIPKDEKSMLEISLEDYRPLSGPVDPDKYPADVESTWNGILNSIKWRQ